MPQVTIDLKTARTAETALYDLVRNYTAARNKWHVRRADWTRATEDRDRAIQHLRALQKRCIMSQVKIDIETARTAEEALYDLVRNYTAARNKWHVRRADWTRLTRKRTRCMQHLRALQKAIDNATND